MGSLMPLFLLLALLSSTHATGPKVTLKVKLMEAFQAKASQDSSFLDMLQKNTYPAVVLFAPGFSMWCLWQS
ncbi:hypothetical protein A6R68_14864 [Neotoma lepida]|uniref:Uncharacterized protein n=1 Tax=Neotoma lepida TaxID=56216 RepID=A0A1A6H8E4_NEOLE|nr:hypothetical protein A6R68_14864 [Neotoma lepida]